MAKKASRNRRRMSLRRVRVTPELALVTLASDTALIVSMTPAAPSTYRFMSLIATWAIEGLTQGEGPITVGLAHGDYTVAEIKECLESIASIDQGDKVAQERANRLIRIVGVLRSDPSGSRLNFGEPIKTRLNWLVTIGDTVKLFAYNESTGALTTGAVLHCQGDVWVKDSA